MITKTHPGDYVRDWRKPIVPQLELLCTYCGGFVLRSLKDGTLHCVDCDGTESIQVLESEGADFRKAKREAMTEQAQADADSLRQEIARWQDQAQDYAEAFPDSLASGLDAAGFGSGGIF